jgi:hypothetical protein
MYHHRPSSFIAIQLELTSLLPFGWGERMGVETSVVWMKSQGIIVVCDHCSLFFEHLGFSLSLSPQCLFSFLLLFIIAQFAWFSSPPKPMDFQKILTSVSRLKVGVRSFC